MVMACGALWRAVGTGTEAKADAKLEDRRQKSNPDRWRRQSPAAPQHGALRPRHSGVKLPRAFNIGLSVIYVLS